MATGVYFVSSDELIKPPVCVSSFTLLTADIRKVLSHRFNLTGVAGWQLLQGLKRTPYSWVSAVSDTSASSVLNSLKLFKLLGNRVYLISLMTCGRPIIHYCSVSINNFPFPRLEVIFLFNKIHSRVEA